MKAQVVDDRLKQALERRLILESSGIATERVDDPLDAEAGKVGHGGYYWHGAYDDKDKKESPSESEFGGRGFWYFVWA